MLTNTRKNGRLLVSAMLLLAGSVWLAACSSSGIAPTSGAGTSEPAGPVWTPESGEDWQTFDEYLQQRAATGEFSGAVSVAKDGQPLLEQGYGMADQERGVANTVQTKFCMASLNTLFTAVAIAQLVEQGKLAFNDTIASSFSARSSDASPGRARGLCTQACVQTC